MNEEDYNLNREHLPGGCYGVIILLAVITFPIFVWLWEGKENGIEAMAISILVLTVMIFIYVFSIEMNKNRDK